MGLIIDVKDNTKEVIEAKYHAIEKALTRMGDTCAKYASGLAPVDTGNLRRSIEKKVALAEEAVYVGTNVEYAIYQEYGTSKMSAANGGRGYLRPAVQDHVEEYKEISQEILGNAFK